ncbi:MAG TPA: class I SAM-dependent rRNA methyltransferase [Bacteroidia bacterium]|jgi:23S rRNA (cytosine1962-C5)-methyltransferase|nr:class I SAM-dependent rRNA methyltransferase [Bacteroidia bacterium]
MSGITKIILGTGKEQSPKRFHPWIFSGAIKRIDGVVNPGDIVEVYSSKDEFLGIGHYQGGSIAVRIFSFEKITPDAEFWRSKIEKAYLYRKAIGLAENNNTNVYRLVFAEGDGLPGLVVDYYNGTAVLQAHSIGMYKERDYIVEALKAVYGSSLKAIYNKSSESLGNGEFAKGVKNGYLYGADAEKQVLENGNKIKVDWEEGQKTGFFIDQRENRKLVAQYAPGKKMLDCFCYAGGFSVYALRAGATEVHSVDSSKTAMKLTDQNIELNFGQGAKQSSHCVDAFDFLKDNQNQYDLMVVDPPAFAKHRDARHQAVMGYKRLNALAISGIRLGGFLFTFSCSQVVDKPLFYGAIMAAAIEAGRNVRIVQYLSQPADHPISIYHSEGEYLKGMLLFVE